MILLYSDGRTIGEVTELSSSRPVGTAPVEFSAQVSPDGAATLTKAPAAFYRGREGEERFTLTIDHVRGATIAGTIRKR